MADEQSTDPFDAVMQRNIAEKSASSQQNEDPFDLVMQKKTSAPSTDAQKAAAADPYEAKIQSHMPEARKRAEELGYTGAIGTGAGEMMLVGPAVREAGTDIAAAAGYGKGETFGERRQDLKAQYEAQRRASGELYPKTQLAADIASQFLVPGVGEIAGPVAAGAEALGAGARLARVAGVATEAGALGAGSAAEEKLIGSKPQAEQAGIGESALIGGTLGAGLGAAGEVASKFAPEWVKSLLSPGDTELTNLSKSLLKDEANGTSKIPINDLVTAVKEGQPVVGADIGGTEFQKALANIAKKNPDAVEGLIDKLKDRLTEGGERFDTFAKQMNNGLDLNIDKLRQDAEDQFSQRNQAAWAPIKDPNLGKGAWLKQWNQLLKEPVFQQAIKNAEGNLSTELGPNFASPFKNSGDTPIANLKLPQFMVDTLNNNGVNTFNDLRKVNKAQLGEMLKVNPTSDTTFANNIAKQQTNQAVQQVLDTIAKVPAAKTTLANPDKVNLQYIDQIRRELGAIQQASFAGNASTQGGIGRKAEEIGKKFMAPLRDPASPNYSPQLDNAIKNSADVFGEKDAFTGGLKLLDKDRDALAKTNAYNTTLAMTQPEKVLAKQGVLASLLTKTRNADGSLNTKMLQKYFDPSNYTAQAIKNLFGTDFERLERFVNTEALFRNTLATISKNVGKSDAGLNDKLRGLRVVPTFLLAKPLAIAQFAYGVAEHYFGQKYARKLAEKLESPNINQFRDAVKMLQANPRVLNAMADGIIRFSANAPGAGYNFTSGPLGNAPINIMNSMVPTRAEGGSVLDDSPPIEMPHSLKELQNWNKNRAKPQSMDDVFTGRVSGFEGASPLAMPASLAELQSYKRTKRATGGRIPDVDKLFKEAKKTLDGQTKPMLNVHDDAIVHALRIAQGRV
jgi:hypothetical protein